MYESQNTHSINFFLIVTSYNFYRDDFCVFWIILYKKLHGLLVSNSAYKKLRFCHSILTTNKKLNRLKSKNLGSIRERRTQSKSCCKDRRNRQVDTGSRRLLEQRFITGIATGTRAEVHECMLSHFSCVQFVATLWTVPRQVSLSIGFSWQEYWNGLPCPPPGDDLPDPGIEPWQVGSLPLVPAGKPWAEVGKSKL